MRRSAGAPGPYSVERAQDRDEYHDRDPALIQRWKDRPYSDVEEPHMDADPEKDARPNRPRLRLFVDEDVVRAAMLIAGGGMEESVGEMEIGRGDILWAEIAPLVNFILDAMQGFEDADAFGSRLDNGVRGADALVQMADAAVKAGFGFRGTRKDWDNFTPLVSRAANFLANRENRAKFVGALSELGEVTLHDFVGAPKKRDGTEYSSKARSWGFEPKKLFASDDAERFQEVFEEGVPGRVPGRETVQTDNYRGMLGAGGFESKIEELLTSMGIVDFEKAQFNDQRVRSILRMVTEAPDSDRASAALIAMLMRDIKGQMGNFIEQMESGGESNFDPETGRIRADMSGMNARTKETFEQWLRMAATDVARVNVRSTGEPYQTMAKNAWRIAMMMTQKLMQNWWKLNAEDAEGRARANIEKYGEKVRRMGVDGVQLRAVVDRVTALADAIRNRDYQAESAVRSELDSLLESAESRAAAVAEMTKRIEAPATIRTVDKEEAEEGIDIGDGLTLKMPSRYHAVSRALREG